MEQIHKTRSGSDQPTQSNQKSNQVGTVILYGIPIVSLIIEAQERLCLAQISNTLLKTFSYNEIHNRRVALGITCVQCTPVQLEILRRAGAMPVSSRRCGMITRREAERLCKSFLGDNAPPRLPEDFAFSVHHECAWGCRGSFLPSRYNSSRAKCIKCSMCGLFFSPNKFIFHSHRIGPSDKYVQPDAANFNSWRRHMKLSGTPSDEIIHAWEDVKAMFNGGTRKRLLQSSSSSSKAHKAPKIETGHPAAHSVEQQVQTGQQQVLTPLIPAPRIPSFQEISLPISRMAMDLMSYHKPFSFAPYSNLPWFKRNPILFPPDSTFFSLDRSYQSAFKPVYSNVSPPLPGQTSLANDEEQKQEISDDEVDIETTDDAKDEVLCTRWSPKPDSIQLQTENSPNTSTMSPNAPISPTPSSVSVVQPKPEFTGPQTTSGPVDPRVDRMWNLGRVAFDRLDRNNLLYRHEFQSRNFVNSRDDTVIATSPLPLTGKTVINCSACQNQHGAMYCHPENNNKVPP